jgi:hypothetical protein
MQVEVRTAPVQLARLSRALREAGNKELRKELNRGLRDATKPLTAAARQNYVKRVPTRGGLSKRASRARMTTQRRGGANASIAIVAKGRGVDLQAIDSGLLRHPVFQSRRNPDPPWVVQRITAHSFSDAMIEGTPAAHREIEAALQRVTDKIERSTDGLGLR